MQTQAKERWKLLCEQAANEPDPHTLMKLIEEITILLEDEEKRLQQLRAADNAA